MATVKALTKDLKKAMGDLSVGYGIGLDLSDRLPSGILALDLALNGGIPRGATSVIYGGEGCGKTTLALLFIAMHQRLYPKQTCALVDAEHAFSPEWGQKLGVDTDSLLVVEPQYGEQAVTATAKLLDAEDIGLVVVDSLATLVPTAEGDADADRVQVGGNSALIGKMMRKTTLSFGNALAEKRKPTLLYLNQTRTQIGTYGSPQGQPGGSTIRFQALVMLQLYSKPVMDKEVSQSVPYARDVTVTVKKGKMSLLATKAEYRMHLIAHNGLPVGSSDDWPTVKKRLFDAGQFFKNEGGKGYTFMGQQVPTLEEARGLYLSQPALRDKIRTVIRDHVATLGVIEGVDEE